MTGVELDNDLIYELDYVAGKIREYLPKGTIKAKTKPGITKETEPKAESPENELESDDEEASESESDPEAGSESGSDPEAGSESGSDPETGESGSDPEASESESGTEPETSSSELEKTETVKNEKKQRKPILGNKKFALKKRKLSDGKFEKVVDKKDQRKP